MTFKYSQLPGKAPILRPVVSVVLSYHQKAFGTYALVDSGATSAAVSTVVADLLEIDWRNIPVTVGAGVGGRFRAHVVTNVTASIERHAFRLRMNVIEGIGDYDCILGQADLFEQADILFRGYKKEFEIKFRKLN